MNPFLAPSGGVNSIVVCGGRRAGNRRDAEHVEDPVAILSRLRSWMVDGGVLCVEVPNVEARCVAPGRRFHFAHFFSFSRQTLEAVGRKAGFATAETTLSPDGGNAIAEYSLGDMYIEGLGVNRNPAIAVAWDRKAAEPGNVTGQTKVWQMYRDCRGV